jgi:hypothetical protein
LAIGASDDAGYFRRGRQLNVQAIGFAHPHSCGLIVAAIIVPIGVDLVVAGQQPQDSHTVRCRFGCRLEILAVRTDDAPGAGDHVGQIFQGLRTGKEGRIGFAGLGVARFLVPALILSGAWRPLLVGLAIGLPTSPDVELRTNQQPFRVFDDSVHLAPFVGLLLTPNDRWFSITYLQLDFDANGNRAFVADNPVGRLRTPTLMYVDCSVGYWLFYNQPSDSGVGHYLTGLAPVVELHYTTTLQNAEGVGGIIEPVSQRVDILNITGGLFFKIGPSAGLTVGGVAPLIVLSALAVLTQVYLSSARKKRMSATSIWCVISPWLART